MVETYYDEGVVSNGSFIIDVGVPNGLSGVCSITFFSDPEGTVPVTPTLGSVTFEVSEDNYNFGLVDQATITYPLADAYNRPNFIGYCHKVRFTLENIVGAYYYVAKVHIQ